MVFIVTDAIDESFGREGVKRPTFMTLALIDRFLGVKESHRLIEQSAKASEDAVA